MKIKEKEYKEMLGKIIKHVKGFEKKTGISLSEMEKMQQKEKEKKILEELCSIRKIDEKELAPVLYEIYYVLDFLYEKKKREDAFFYLKYHDLISDLKKHSVEYRIYFPGPKIWLDWMNNENEKEIVSFRIQRNGGLEENTLMLFENMCDILNDLGIEEMEIEKRKKTTENYGHIKRRKFFHNNYEKFKKERRYHKLDMNLEKLVELYERIKK